MTSFARYYEERKLYEISMSEIEKLLENESNKEQIADIIYHRYYDRYLKPFFYSSFENQTYVVNDQLKSTKILNEFNTEYKSGFVIMTSCCLLIETVSTFFDGLDQSKNGSTTFKAVFKKATEYSNNLSIFENQPFYNNIRCGLTHQGETYGKFKISRNGQLFDEENLTINATLFCNSLKDFLRSYCEELKTSKWDTDIWDKCRIKLRYIIKNSR